MAKAGLLYVGTVEGVVLFSEPGAAGRWLRVGRELRDRAVDSLWLSYDNPQIVLAAAGAELWRSVDGGQSWQLVPEVPGGALAGHRSAPDQAWCAQAGQVWRSADRGVSWERCAAGDWARPAALVAGDAAATLALAEADRLWLSNDGGRAWRDIGRAPAAITGLSAGESVGGWCVTAGQRLFRVSERGWIEDGAAPAAQGAVAVLGGREPAVLLALAGGGVGRGVSGAWEAPDGSHAWVQAPTAILAAPYHVDTAFAGGDGVVALSTDRGRSWQVLRTDLPPVRALAAGRLL